MGFGNFLLSAGSRAAFIIGGVLALMVGAWAWQYINMWSLLIIILGFLLIAYGICKKSRNY